MKIGALEFHWHPGTSTLRETVMGHLREDPQVRQIAARMARSEVKSYLAELSEQAGRPFLGPELFIGYLERKVENVELPNPDELRA